MNLLKTKSGKYSIHNSFKKKYPEINLTKEIRDIHSERFKMPKKETEGDIRRGRELPYSWISRLHTVTIAMLPKQSTVSI